MPKQKHISILVGIVIIVFFVGVFIYFNGVIKQQQIEQQNKIEQQKIVTENTLFVSGVVAVSLNPSDEWLKDMEKNGGDDFYTMADDDTYYLSTAEDFLKTKNIKMVLTDKRYLDFRHNALFG